MDNIYYIIHIVAAIWVIYSVWTSKEGMGSRIIWTILALLFSVITAIVYYLMKKK